MIRQLTLATLSICLSMAPDALADDRSIAATSSPTAGTSQSSVSGKPIQGSVKTIDVEAAECLRQMGDCLKKMQRASLELMGEATRQDYIAVGDPDVVGTIIIPAIPAPSGMMAVGPYLPIREKWMDYYLLQIGKLIPMYADLTDSLVMPDSAKEEATKLLDQMRPRFEDAKQQYLSLLNMSKDLKNVKNNDVAETSVRLHDDMDKMDKLRKEVFKLLKESEKKS